METNGNGYTKAIVIGVAIFVLGTVVVGSGGGTIKNTIVNSAQQIEVDNIKQDMAEQKADIAKIPVMDERIKDIKEDVGKILEIINR